VVSGISRMIPKPITAPFRWWAKHPWIVVWGMIPFSFVISYALVILLQPSYFVRRTILVPFIIVWILCWWKGVSVTWQRSKVRAVLAAVLFMIGFVLIATPNSLRPSEGRDLDRLVKSDIKNATTAQEAHFVDNDTYTSTSSRLRGFNPTSNVKINMEATTTTYIITGIVTRRRCKPNTGRWVIDSTTGAINGTPCRLTGAKLWLTILEKFWS